MPTPVLAYLDEFGTLGRIPQFPARMATIRASRFGVVLVVQALHQLAATYGREGATILTNATTKLCLARVSGEDADYFSRLAGTATVHSRSRGRSRATVAPLADRGNVGTGEAARPLLTPDELRTMGGGVLVVAADRHPLLARQRRYYRVPALVRRLPLGRPAAPGDPDPLVPFRARRAADPLPDAALVVPEVAGDDASGIDGVTAGPGAAVTTVAAPTTPARAPLVPAAAAPPRAAGAPAALSCRDAPGPAGAPPISRGDTTAAPATPASSDAPIHASPAPIRLSVTQRAVLDALAECGRPTATISSADVAARTGINRSTVRAALRELRGKLGVEQGADLVVAARAGGLLAGEAASDCARGKLK